MEAKSVLKDRNGNPINRTLSYSTVPTKKIKINTQDDSNHKRFKSQEFELSPIESKTQTSTIKDNSSLYLSSYSTPIVPSNKTSPNSVDILSLDNLNKPFKRKITDENDNYFYAKTEIDAVLTCPLCKQNFNTNEKQPKIICDRLTACFQCVRNKNKIECTLCCKSHYSTEKGFSTNSTILYLINIKPTRINNEEFLIQSKIDKSIEDVKIRMNFVTKMNLKTESKLEEITKGSTKDELKRCLEKVDKCKEIYATIIEKLSELDSLFEQTIDNEVVELSVYQPEVSSGDVTEIKLNFSGMNDLSSFYPMSRNSFFNAEKQTNPDLESNSNDFKLNVLSQNMALVHHKLVKQIPVESVRVIFDPKYLFIILCNSQKQFIATYEFNNRFHNLKCIGSNKKILYLNSEEIVIYSEVKSTLTVLDFEFNKKDVFGQSENESNKFYLPKNEFEILYLNDKKLYLKDEKKRMLRVIDRKTGDCLYTFFHDSNMYMEKILMDKSNRFILVDKSNKKILFLDENLNELKKIEMNFENSFDDFYLTIENELAFVYFSQNLIKFVKI